MSATDVTALESRIAERIDPGRAQSLKVEPAMGGLVIRDMQELMDFAKMMSIGNISVPKHLRANPGACIAVILQAIEWKMSPFAVANKSYSVNDRLAYESQLIHAIILMRAPIRGRIQFAFSGEGPTRHCTVSATLSQRGGGVVEYTSPELSNIPVKNSPLWKNDPDQQLGYYSVRALARRHFPDVIMGVYEREEMRLNAIDGEAIEVAEDKASNGKDKSANPVSPKSRKTLQAKLESLAETTPAGDPTPPSQGEGEIIEDNAPMREGAVADEADEDEEEEEEEEENSDALADEPPQREQDALFERLRPAAEKGSRALKLAIGKLTEDEVLALTEITHERLERIIANRTNR
jgi:hypothetical protein